MNWQNAKLVSAGLLLLRVGVCALMLTHGLAKLNGFADMHDKFPDPLSMGSKVSLILAIVAEVGCSLLLAVGFLTRLAAIPLMVTMGVALFAVHAADPWKVKELAASYLLIYATLVLTGPGLFSVDRAVFGRNKVEAAA